MRKPRALNFLKNKKQEKIVLSSKIDEEGNESYSQSQSKSVSQSSKRDVSQERSVQPSIGSDQ